jgi:hypothetical protein
MDNLKTHERHKPTDLIYILIFVITVVIIIIPQGLSVFY